VRARYGIAADFGIVGVSGVEVELSWGPTEGVVLRSFSFSLAMSVSGFRL
jgi:hypothetical protein